MGAKKKKKKKAKNINSPKTRTLHMPLPPSGEFAVLIDLNSPDDCEYLHKMSLLPIVKVDMYEDDENSDDSQMLVTFIVRPDGFKDE